ncbi:MAG: DoxX family protein [Caulobacter sp.]
MNRLAGFAPQTLSLLRIVAALGFLAHGLMKIFHFPVAQPGAPDPLIPILVVAGWMEIVGGGLLLIGLFTRPVAFVLSGMMAVAYFAAHVARGGFFPAINGGEAAMLYSFVFLYLACAGGGPWSVDAARKK